MVREPLLPLARGSYRELKNPNFAGTRIVMILHFFL
jgi:hypothetical protein